MSEFIVEASEDGEILRFKNAVLARVETNNNMDEIDEEGAVEVAQTLPLMPIDIEHQMQRICGQFTDARYANGPILTDGLVYAGRYPQEANDLRTGDLRLSIEARAREAECSVCGGRFRGSENYCEHLRLPLRERRSQGIRRKLHGLKAVGGALTKRPAGTDTAFDTQSITMIASLTMEEEDLAFVAQLNDVLRGYGLRILEA